MMAFREIPLVDISGLGDTDPARHAKTVEDIRKAASQVGFLYVSGHGIPAETIARLRAATEAFFARPQDEKMKVYIGNSRNHRGYVPEGEEVFYGGSKDKKEAFDLSIDLPADDPDYVSGNPLLGPNQWPEDMPEFHDAVSAYYDAIFALGHRLLHGFAEALGLEPTALDEYFAKPPSQLRLIHYPYDPAPDVQGIGAHTDYEVFTLLLPTAPGLEVMNGKGEWIDAPPVEGAFVVNIGDMLEVWSNGVFTATSHRVRKVQEERYSFPLFFSCDYWTKVEPLPAFVSADRPAAYPPVIAGEHLHAQTVQTFTYLKERLARGEIDMPEGSLGLSSFGREARVRGT
ncbi:2-oxoglutarate and iron-dependent oxygenase domain-containing protein [uncultured Parvibaculum sp.]|uniref:isopenicillin N synthase family dioxygenase n=2 Tax=Parvibaculum TaxID=256616 RepID=UPI0030DB2A41